MSDNIIDLDALLPQEVTIKLGGREYAVPPPKTEDVLRLAAIGQKAANADEMSPEELEKLSSDLTAQIHKSIPELNNQPLTMQQLFKLLSIITDMGTPSETKELEKKGISTSDPKAP